MGRPSNGHSALSERRLPGWLKALLWIGAVIGALIGIVVGGYYLWMDDGDRCPQGRMPWSCITWVTIDRYERQLREDLPIGTPRQQVEAYLHHEGVPFFEFDAYSGLPTLRIEKSLTVFFEASVSYTLTFGRSGDLAEISVGRSMNAP